MPCRSAGETGTLWCGLCLIKLVLYPGWPATDWMTMSVLSHGDDYGDEVAFTLL